MAQKVLVQLVDDLDKTTSDDIETIQFGLDGVTYEIDLTAVNAERLRDGLAEFVTAARRTGGRVKRGSRPKVNGADASEAGQIRSWAAANGIELAPRGRIPGHVVEAYKQSLAEPTAASNGVKPRRGRAKKS